jgi:hypothetical protein
MYTRQRTGAGGTVALCAEGARRRRTGSLRRFKAWPRRGLREGSESRVPEWPGGAVVGSPGRRAAEAAIYIPRSNLRVTVRSCEGEGLSKTGASSDPCGWREAPAAEPLGAWHA